MLPSRSDFRRTDEEPSADLSVLPAEAHLLSSSQMQRLVVAQHYWPDGFATMGTRLQRQVIAECVHEWRHGALAPIPKC